jgi:hypothetical protein
VTLQFFYTLPGVVILREVDKPCMPIEEPNVPNYQALAMLQELNKNDLVKYTKNIAVRNTMRSPHAIYLQSNTYYDMN